MTFSVRVPCYFLHISVLTIAKPTKIALPAHCLNGQSEIHLHYRLLRAAAHLLRALLEQPLPKKWQRKKATPHMGLEMW